MTTDSIEVAKQQYAYGQDAFERGNYRAAVEYFEQAVKLTKAATPLGGEIQTWLVNAYSAIERQADAVALCEKLSHHPDPEIRKQAKNLLYILRAPQLKRPSNWMSQIPDLGSIDTEGEASTAGRSYAVAPRAAPPRLALAEPEPIDPSQINRQDNGFLWAALVALVLMLGGVLWLS